MSEQTPPSVDEKQLGPLPPVQPPSVGFLLQLFVIPLIIVAIIVMVWLMLNWLAHMGTSPKQMVHDLRRLNDASWQKALTLAELLRNPDYDHLKVDEEMAGELGDVLMEQLDASDASEESIRLRMFLCRALGEFRVPVALPPLLRAAVQENAFEDLDVRRAALEAIAVFADSNDAAGLRTNRELMEVIKQASRERSASQDDRESRSELRSTAAFALGILGGDEARDRMALMVTDAYSNARYNAGLGLARSGDVRALPVLLEMLDPDNEHSSDSEEHEVGKASKRLLIITNGMRGAAEFVQQNRGSGLADIKSALQAIEESDLTLFSPRARNGIRIKAKEALLLLND